ncbi:MAG: hypothetical protein PWP09_1318 [Thermotogota bacterium]|nr:hypothetical protein [Thermotogota bacterium]
MPKDTFFNLDEEKRNRVFQAILNEFIRAPLEEALVKNIVNNAKIPRGSFYQYFVDKEDALRYLISKIRAQGEKEIIHEVDLAKTDVYNYIRYIFLREKRFIDEGHVSYSMKLLDQIAKSERATTIFNEVIINSMKNNSLFKSSWINSGLNRLPEEKQEAIMELLISSLKEALLFILHHKDKSKEAQEKLEFKLTIIKEGINAMLKR